MQVPGMLRMPDTVYPAAKQLSPGTCKLKCLCASTLRSQAGSRRATRHTQLCLCCLPLACKCRPLYSHWLARGRCRVVQQLAGVNIREPKMLECH